MIIQGMWILFALSFYLFSLWTFLECVRKKRTYREAKEFLKQGIFVSVCVGLAILVDIYFMPTIEENYFSGSLTFDIVRFFTLPVILFIGSVTLGPSTPIRINKPPSLGNKQKTKQTRRRR
jgi:hypothetical protein